MENISHATLKASDWLINLTVNSATSSLLVTAPVPVTAATLLVSVASEQRPGSLQDPSGPSQPFRAWAWAEPSADALPLQPGATLRAGPRRRCCLLCRVISYKPLGFALGITKCLAALFAFYSLTARISKSSEVWAHRCCSAVSPAFGFRNKIQLTLNAYKERKIRKPI